MNHANASVDRRASPTSIMPRLLEFLDNFIGRIIDNLFMTPCQLILQEAGPPEVHGAVLLLRIMKKGNYDREEKFVDD
jgi:hypothetical protein